MVSSILLLYAGLVWFFGILCPPTAKWVAQSPYRFYPLVISGLAASILGSFLKY